MSKIFQDYLGRGRTIEEFTISELDGDDYGVGQLEALERGEKKTREAFARLLALLSSQKLLSDSDIHQIVAGFRPEE